MNNRHRVNLCKHAKPASGKGTGELAPGIARGKGGRKDLYAFSWIDLADAFAMPVEKVQRMSRAGQFDPTDIFSVCKAVNRAALEVRSGKFAYEMGTDKFGYPWKGWVLRWTSLNEEVALLLHDRMHRAPNDIYKNFHKDPDAPFNARDTDWLRLELALTRVPQLYGYNGDFDVYSNGVLVREMNGEPHHARIAGGERQINVHEPEDDVIFYAEWLKKPIR